MFENEALWCYSLRKSDGGNVSYVINVEKYN